mmetsp:Transcript_126401/g.229509  ORF Transcript_126401/g.229509 Transcript_126401/m.229509 type:complete len:125 (+) Transcript_126401:1043-1417(+)
MSWSPKQLSSSGSPWHSQTPTPLSWLQGHQSQLDGLIVIRHARDAVKICNHSSTQRADLVVPVEPLVASLQQQPARRPPPQEAAQESGAESKPPMAPIRDAAKSRAPDANAHKGWTKLGRRIEP